jgi:hypothetical protein
MHRFLDHTCASCFQSGGWLCTKDNRSFVEGHENCSSTTDYNPCNFCLPISPVPPHCFHPSLEKTQASEFKLSVYKPSPSGLQISLSLSYTFCLEEEGCKLKLAWPWASPTGGQDWAPKDVGSKRAQRWRTGGKGRCLSIVTNFYWKYCISLVFLVGVYEDCLLLVC